MTALLNKRGDSMFLRLNLREATLLKGLADGGAGVYEVRTLIRLQSLGLVSARPQGQETDPLTQHGLAWLKDNPTSSGR
jgi:hypothetical protein